MSGILGLLTEILVLALLYSTIRGLRNFICYNFSLGQGIPVQCFRRHEIGCAISLQGNNVIFFGMHGVVMQFI